MNRKIFIPLHEEEVAPRFDLATEVLIAECDGQNRLVQEKILILPGPSSERLCHMIATERIQTVICGAIEQEVYDYLTWKRVEVIDDVVGPSGAVLKRYSARRLKSGDVLGLDSAEDNPPGIL